MQPGVFQTLAAGSELSIVREPENPHDELAIAILTGSGKKIGYVPRNLDAVPAALADQGVELGAEIVELDPDAPTWERVLVRMWERV